MIEIEIEIEEEYLEVSDEEGMKILIPLSFSIVKEVVHK